MHVLLPLAALLTTAHAQESAPTSDPLPAEEGAPTGPSNDELGRRIDILAEEIERMRIGDAAAPPPAEGVGGLGPAASRVYSGDQGVSIGGYGDLRYTNFSETDQSGDDSGEVDEVDVLRLILYTGYKFNEKWVLNTEIEFEHVNEVYVEFAFVDYKASDALGFRAGLLLIPVGIHNEFHEPTTFTTVGRPQLETWIVPTTFREMGLGVYGDLGPFAYRAVLVNGFDAAGFSDSHIRGGRQKAARAKAEDWAGAARLDFVGVQGLMVGGSAYYGNSGQDMELGGSEVDVPTLIYEGHASLDVAGLRARAMFAGVSLDDVAKLNEVLGYTGNDTVGELLYGYYADLAYDIFGPLGVDGQKLMPVVRYEYLDTQASVPAGYSADPAHARSYLIAGLSYHPHSQIAFKADYQVSMNDADSGVNQLNAGLGFIF